jgi:hypothetical protein
MPKATVLQEFNKYVPGEEIEIPNQLIGENQIDELTKSGHIAVAPTKEAEEKAKLEAKHADEKAKLEAKQAEEKATLEKKQTEEAAKLEKQAEPKDEGVEPVFEESFDAKKNKK